MKLTLEEAYDEVKANRKKFATRVPFEMTDERDIADEDYPGRGLEFEFWDIPN